MTKLFIASVTEYSQSNDVPLIHFAKGQCKEDLVRPYFDAMRAKGIVEGVALIGIAQERVCRIRLAGFDPSAGEARQTGGQVGADPDSDHRDAAVTGTVFAPVPRFRRAPFSNFPAHIHIIV